MSKQISWVTADGVEYPLNKENKVRLLKGMKGFSMPTFSYSEEEVPFQAGSRLRDVRTKARDMDLPLKIECDTEIELESKIREFLRVFNPTKSDGTFKSIASDGSQREIKCRYISGFEMDESHGVRGETWQKAVGVFRAFDPHWYDSQTIVETFRLNESPGLFFPILPLRLVSSTVFADISINNTGDVETFPEWIITGPGENIVISNLTTGEQTKLELKLESWESLTINTVSKTITKNDGTNLFYTMTDDSSLWSLKEGENSIRLEMSIATEDSSVQLSYRPRYWGP